MSVSSDKGETGKATVSKAPRNNAACQPKKTVKKREERRLPGTSRAISRFISVWPLIGGKTYGEWGGEGRAHKNKKEVSQKTTSLPAHLGHMTNYESHRLGQSNVESNVVLVCNNTNHIYGFEALKLT